MIKGETITVYYWFDIQKEICEVMNIPYSKFRDYHEIVGGNYKDLWHVTLDTVVPDSMHNGSIVTMYALEDWSINRHAYLKDHGDWTEPFFDAYNKVMEELDPDFNGVNVRFSW